MHYAILFSGMSFRRHVNGLEFCYRTLVDRLGFAADHIHVLNYDGTLGAFGDQDVSSTCRMVVNGPGTRAAFQQALSAVARQLTADDQLFINTTGHGGHHGSPQGPDLITYPHSTRYRRDDFCADLAVLPPHRLLTVLMTQCFSGGFIDAVLAASPAEATCIATATSATRQSYLDTFQRNWVEALAGRSLHEAFQQASHPDVVDPYDSPQFAARPIGAAEARLTG